MNLLYQLILCVITAFLFFSSCNPGISEKTVKPDIDIQPRSFPVTIGHNPTLYIHATGTEYLTYQWQKNHTDISGKTDSCYTIEPVIYSDSTIKYRCIVKNDVGSDTSVDVSFSIIPDSATDVDGNVYSIVTIGSQIWFAENLRTTRYCDGTKIPFAQNTTEWKNFSKPPHNPCYAWHKYDSTLKNNPGAYYNGHVVRTEKLAPVGWHIPTNTDWDVLVTFLGGSDIAAAKLKKKGFDY